MKKHSITPPVVNKTGGYRVESPVAKGANPLGSAKPLMVEEEGMIDSPAESADETTSQVLRRDDETNTPLYKRVPLKPKM